MFNFNYFNKISIILSYSICIYANTPHELQQMLQELADEIENQCLKKAMIENDTQI